MVSQITRKNRTKQKHYILAFKIQITISLHHISLFKIWKKFSFTLLSRYNETVEIRTMGDVSDDSSWFSQLFEHRLLAEQAPRLVCPWIPHNKYLNELSFII